MHSTEVRDPATLQTAAGFPLVSEMDTSFVFSDTEIRVLRDLAMKVREHAESDSEKEKARLWTAHNDLGGERPMVFIDPENGWNEVIPPSTLVCHDPLARVWEIFLRKQLYWVEIVRDDKVIEPYFDVPFSYADSGWGVELKRHGGADGGSYIVDPVITDYGSDLPKVGFPQIVIDHEASDRLLDLAHGVLGKNLIVRRKNTWWWTLGMTSDFINLRGLDNLMMDLILQPEHVHATMAFLRDGYLERLTWLEEHGYLSSNTEGTYVGSGGFGWTTKLPVQGEIPGRVALKDMWGFCESQETVGVSPEMFNEFVLPYQIPILDRFGLNCYGCCEPLDKRWEYVQTIPRLRRVSASPWADKQVMADCLGGDYVMSVKPSPTPLATSVMDEASVRRELRDTLSVTRGCNVELIMKDNHTLGGNPDHLRDWVAIAREEIDRA